MWRKKTTRPASIDNKTVDQGKKDDYEFDILLYRVEVKDYGERTRTVTASLGKIYSVVWGQCTEATKSKVKTMKEYATVVEEMDLVDLLYLIRKVTYDFDSDRLIYHSYFEVHKASINFRQVK